MKRILKRQYKRTALGTEWVEVEEGIRGVNGDGKNIVQNKS